MLTSVQQLYIFSKNKCNSIYEQCTLSTTTTKQVSFGALQQLILRKMQRIFYQCKKFQNHRKHRLWSLSFILLQLIPSCIRISSKLFLFSPFLHGTRNFASLINFGSFRNDTTSYLFLTPSCSISEGDNILSKQWPEMVHTRRPFVGSGTTSLHVSSQTAHAHIKENQ